MDKNELDDLEAKANAATPGPWSEIEDVVTAVAWRDEPYGTLQYLYEDNAFIVACRQAVPRLIARVRELEARCASHPSLPGSLGPSDDSCALTCTTLA